MAQEKVFTRDSISGQVAWVPRSYLNIFENLEEVEEGTKPRAVHKHAETDKDGKDASGKQVRTPKKAVDADPSPADPVNS
jgi:hypothetical protein